MASWAKVLVAALFSTAIVVATAVVGNTVLTVFRSGNVVTMTGTAREELLAQRGDWNLTIRSHADTESAARARGRSDRAAVLEWFQKVGVERDAVRLGATVAAEDAESEGRWLAEQSFAVRDVDAALLLRLVSAATALEAVGRDVLTGDAAWSFPDRAEVRRRLQLAAATEAREQASRLASAAGGRLGTLHEVAVVGEDDDETEERPTAAASAGPRLQLEVAVRSTYEVAP